MIDEKTHKNIAIYDISYKTLIGAKPLHIIFKKIDGFNRIYNGTKFFSIYYLVLKNILPCTIELDVL